jgi:hypothetical protein
MLDSHDRETEPLQSEALEGGQTEFDSGEGIGFSQVWDREAIACAWRDLSRGAAGEDWTRTVGSVALLLGYQQSVVGGIVTQLISEVQDRLGKSEECIEWYQREVEEYRVQLARLQALQSAIAAAAPPEDA